jgi:hypothetical protein
MAARSSERLAGATLDHSTATMAASIEQSPFFQQMRAKGAIIVTGTTACLPALAVHGPPELR